MSNICVLVPSKIYLCLPAEKSCFVVSLGHAVTLTTHTPQIWGGGIFTPQISGVGVQKYCKTSVFLTIHPPNLGGKFRPPNLGGMGCQGIWVGAQRAETPWKYGKLVSILMKRAREYNSFVFWNAACYSFPWCFSSVVFILPWCFSSWAFWVLSAYVRGFLSVLRGCLWKEVRRPKKKRRTASSLGNKKGRSLPPGNQSVWNKIHCE